jgi:hypothetical protein
VQEGKDRESRWNGRNELIRPMRAGAKTKLERNAETNSCRMRTQSKRPSANANPPRTGRLAGGGVAGGVPENEVRGVNLRPKSR